MYKNKKKFQKETIEEENGKKQAKKIRKQKVIN